MLQSGFAEQLAKADVLLFIKPERVFITRRSGLLIGLVCRVSVHIHIWLKKGSRLGSDPGLAEREPLSDENPPLRLPGGSVPGAILQPFRDKKNPSVRTGADWSGHRNRSVLPCCILRQE